MTLTYNSKRQKIVKHYQTAQFDENVTNLGTLRSQVYLLEKAFGILDIFDEYILAAPKIRA